MPLHRNRAAFGREGSKTLSVLLWGGLIRDVGTSRCELIGARCQDAGATGRN